MHSTPLHLQQFFKNKLFYYGLFFVIAFLIIFLRRPDSLLNPQFWAEDGACWYADAYQRGYSSLLIAYNGQFLTLQRIVGILAQPLPFRLVPLFFNLCAYLVQITVFLFILSPRLSNVLPSKSARLVCAFLLLLLPASSETNANINNGHTYLALLSFLLIIAQKNGQSPRQWIDRAVLLLSGLSGVYVILLAPIAFIYWCKNRNKESLVNLLILLAGCTIQLLALFLINRNGREYYPPPNFTMVVVTISQRVFLGALLGVRIAKNTLAWSALLRFLSAPLFLVMFYASRKCPFELKLLLLFSVLIIATAFISPTGKAGPAGIVFNPLDGLRYFFMPEMAFLLTLIWSVWTTQNHTIKALALIYLLVLPIGIAADFVQSPFVDLSFQKYAETFESAPKGTEINIPLNPPGWSMELIKH